MPPKDKVQTGTTLTIRSIDPELKARLRRRAADHGQSMEAEVRQILRDSLEPKEPDQPSGLGSRIVARFADLDLTDFEIPDRTGTARYADFGE